MPEVDSLVIKLEADLTQLKRELRQAQTQTQRAGRRMSQSFRRVGDQLRGVSKRMLSFRAAIGVVAGSAGIGLLAKNALNAADSLEDFSRLTAVGIERLQELRFAADFVGTGAQTLDKALIRLQKSMGEVASGQTSEAEDAFKALGLSQKDLIRLSGDTGEAFQEILVRIQNMGGEMEKTTALADIFGLRIGPRLKLLAQQGQEGIERLAQRARESGAVMDKELVKQASDLKDEFTALGHALETSFQTGLLREAVGEMENMEGETQRIAKGFEGIGTAVGVVLGLVAKLGRGIGDVDNALTQGAIARGDFKLADTEKGLFEQAQRTQAEILARRRGNVFFRGVRGVQGALGITQSESELRDQLARIQQARSDLAAALQVDEGAATATAARPEIAAPVDTTAQEKREKALTSIRESIQALREEADTLKLAEDARAAYAAKLEVERQLREAGISLQSEQAQKLIAEAQAATKAVEAQDRMNQSLSEFRDVLERSKTDQERMNEQIAHWKQLADAGKISTEDLARAQAQLKKELDETKTKTTEAKTATVEAALSADRLGESLGNALDNAIRSGEGFKGILRALLGDLARMGIEILKLDFSKLGGSTGGGGFDFGSLFGKGGGGSNFFSSLFSSGGSSGGFVSGTPAFDTGSGFFKRGGRVGGRPGTKPISPVFAGAPRFQSGGLVGLSPKLNRDEVPIVAHTGEMVLNREQTRQHMRGGQSERPISVVMQISTPDADSFRANQDQLVGRLGNALRHAQRNM